MRVPVPAKVQWRQGADGRVLLQRRRFGPIRSAVLRALRMSPDIRVHLDHLGTATWLLVDGQRTVDDIHRELRRQFPDEEDLPRRLGQYLGTLASGRFLRLR